MRSLPLLLLLTACGPDYALQDDFSDGLDPLFTGPEDQLAPAYIRGATFQMELRGPEPRIETLELVSEDPAIIEVVDVITETNDTRSTPRRVATVRTTGPGTTTLSIVDDGTVRHSAPVTVGDPDRIEVRAVLHTIIGPASPGFSVPTALDAIDVLAGSQAEVQLVPFASDVALVGSAGPTRSGEGITVASGSYQNPDPFEVYALAADADAMLSVAYSDATFTVPVRGHATIADLRLERLDCDQTRSALGECVVVALAETSDGAPLLGVFPDWRATGELQWASRAPGDLWSFRDGDEGGTSSLITLTASAGDRSADATFSVRASPEDDLDQRFEVRNSNEVVACSHTDPAALWLGLGGLIVVVGRRRRQRSTALPTS